MRTPCSICAAPSVARALCKNHYRAFMKFGDPLHRANLRGVPFDERYTIDDATGCWLWVGGTNTSGYGCYAAEGQKTAHRVAYIRFKGPIPPGMHVLHKCDRPNCVNPEHLFLGTHQDNMVDLRKKGRAYGAKGEANFGAKLTAAQAEAIMADPRSAQVIAQEYGVTLAAVGLIRNGRTWAHLFDESVRQARLAADGRRRLSDSEREAIFKDPRTQMQIAAAYGISQSRVSAIKRAFINLTGEPP